ncbi:unnamed protein product [Orchesella dallaii]|uniref:Uncharacterized protein n=1 Tax=Orchesella dallaii TaxID=48710 RepID=A0ABP1RD62_9HEXA
MKIIMGAFLLLLFHSSLHTGGECEAGTITVPIIPNSKNVSTEDIINSGDYDFDQEDVMITDKNVSSSADPIVVDDVDSASKDVEKSEPCPLSLPRGDGETGDAIHNHGNESNSDSSSSSSLPSPTSSTQEKQTTAFEQITDSISGVFSTLKSSVASIFSSGSGPAEPEKSEDATNCTTQAKEGITNAENTNANNSNSTLDNATEGKGAEQEEDHHHHQHSQQEEDHKLESEDGNESMLLIHSDVSSNDNNNSTNDTQVTSTTSTTTTTLSPNNTTTVEE